MIKPFILPTIAGLSTILGYLIIYIKEKKEIIITKSLALASGTMLAISIIELIPQSIILSQTKLYKIPSYILITLALTTGIIIANILNQTKETKSKYNQLYKLGIISMITIIIHNIPEGIITYITTKTSLTLGIKITLAITLHNIPEGITIAIPIYYTTKSKKKALTYTTLAGLSELLGAIIAHLFLPSNLSPVIIAIIYMTIAGLMIKISLALLKQSLKQKQLITTIICFLLGTIIMYISHAI